MKNILILMALAFNLVANGQSTPKISKTFAKNLPLKWQQFYSIKNSEGSKALILKPKIGKLQIAEQQIAAISSKFENRTSHQNLQENGYTIDTQAKALRVSDGSTALLEYWHRENNSRLFATTALWWDKVSLEFEKLEGDEIAPNNLELEVKVYTWNVNDNKHKMKLQKTLLLSSAPNDQHLQTTINNTHGKALAIETIAKTPNKLVPSGQIHYRLKTEGHLNFSKQSQRANTPTSLNTAVLGKKN